MKFNPHARMPLALLLASLLVAGCSFSASARLSRSVQRDHLTPEEIEHVRDAQELDLRTAVFIKAAERRMLALTGGTPAPKSKQARKDAEEWGELPASTRAELLSDVAQILDEASTNIDDVSARNPGSSLLMKSLRKLADACTHFLTQLKPMRDSVAGGPEREALEQAIENAQAIIDAANKLPASAKE